MIQRNGMGIIEKYSNWFGLWLHMNLAFFELVLEPLMILAYTFIQNWFNVSTLIYGVPTVRLKLQKFCNTL